MPAIIKKPLIGVDGPCWTAGHSRPVDHILLHHTASGGSGSRGGADAVWNYQHGLHSPNRTSEHYILGKDGSIIEAVSMSNSAWHAGSGEWNSRSIGIEIVNLGDGKDPFPQIQMENLAWLCRHIRAKFPVIDVKPLQVVDGHQRLGDIWEHAAVCEGKIDMRENFPWKKLYCLITTTGKVLRVPEPRQKPDWWPKLLAYQKRMT